MRRQCAHSPWGPGFYQTNALFKSSLEVERDQIAHYESQFAQIKDVMGVSVVGEIIDKFTSQEETHATLESLIRESQAKIDTLIQGAPRTPVHHPPHRRS